MSCYTLSKVVIMQSLKDSPFKIPIQCLGGTEKKKKNNQEEFATKHSIIIIIIQEIYRAPTLWLNVLNNSN